MKRFITILIIILILISIVLGIAWIFSRKTAEKAGTAKPTFRQFLSGESTTGQLTPNDGNLSSVFVDDNLGSATLSPESVPTIGTQVASFTNGTTTLYTDGGVSGDGSPTSTSGGTTPGSGAPTTTTTTTTVTVDPTTETPAPVPPALPGPECSDADLNIEFNASDIAKLNVLQNRFYALAQTLYTDADVAIETGNHDNFKSKVDKITELYNTCHAYATTETATHGKITDPIYTARVPTPFWHEISTDKETFITANGSVNGNLTPVPDTIMQALINPLTYQQTISSSGTNAPAVIFALHSLERALRLNLW